MIDMTAGGVGTVVFNRCRRGGAPIAFGGCRRVDHVVQQWRENAAFHPLSPFARRESWLLHQRLFARGDESANINPDPFGRDPPPANKDSIQQTFARALLHRDETLDAKSRICGYRFYVCPLEEMPCSGGMISAR